MIVNQLAKLIKISKGMSGFSIDYRPHEKSWPMPYRVKIISTKYDDLPYFGCFYGADIENAINNTVSGYNDFLRTMRLLMKSMGQ